jgi:hypothetical protein
MCRRVTCSICGKPTFAGCGMHVQQVLGDVPPVERCKCKDARSAAREPGRRQSVWDRLFGGGG